MKKLLLLIIRVYQKTLSPDEGLLSYRHPHGYCKFYPHCSEYAYQSIERFGTVKGLFLSIKRVFKCHPFSKGGIDPVPFKN